MEKLYRSLKDRWIAGVCGGIARHYNVDPTIIRLAWSVLSVFSLGVGIVVYIIAAIIIPNEEAAPTGV